MRKLALVIAVLISPVMLVAAEDQEGHAAPKVRTAPTNLDGDERRAVELYRKIVPAVVTVYTERKRLTANGPVTQSGLGSGVLIAPKCHVLTAAHVVDGADEIRVKTSDGTERKAELIYSQDRADIALLKLKKFDPDLPHAELGDSDQLAIGQRTYVVGAPSGLENSFTVGHISGFREFDRLYDGTVLAEYIQTDAAINSGNSGGPVFNSSGEVIGIASRILSHSGGFEGLGFVVAINTAKQLLALEDHPWIGIEGLFLNREGLAALLNHDFSGGLLLQRVAKGSPADRAGLRGGWFVAQYSDQEILLGGDLILEFGDQEACHSECLMRAGKTLGKKNKIRVTYLRQGKVEHAVIDVSKNRRNFLE